VLTKLTPLGSANPTRRVAHKTDDGKNTYYHNKSTAETTWTMPPGFVAPAAAAPAAAPAAAAGQMRVEGTEWVEVTQPNGPSYFHHPGWGSAR
jgi:hypothetical protein